MLPSSSCDLRASSEINQRRRWLPSPDDPFNGHIDGRLKCYTFMGIVRLIMLHARMRLASAALL
jgi:hypothetical protein